MDSYDIKYAWRATPLLGSVALLVMYTEAMLMPSLPKIQAEFNVTPADASWILTIYLIVGTISAAVFGNLGDIYGKKKVLTAVIATYAAAVTFTGYAPNFESLLVARAIQGLGMAMFPLAFSLIREEFPPQMVPTAQGVVSAMFGVGIIIALPVGAYIAQNFGWRATYHTATPIAVLLTLAVWLYIRESRYRTPRKVDLFGIALFALAAASFLLAISKGPDWGWTSQRIVTLFLLSGVSTAVFILHELTTDNPFIPRDIFNRNVAAATFAILIVAYAFQMNSQNLSYLLQMPPPYGYGLTVLQTGLYMLPPAVVQIIVAPLAGRAMWRLGAKKIAVAGVAFAAVGYQLAAAHLYSGIWTLISYLTLGFVGLTLLNVSLINLLTFSVPRQRLGAATGLNTVFRNLGSAIAPTVAGTILTNYSTYVYFNTPNGPVYFSVPSRDAYVINIDIATAMFISALAPILIAKEVLGRDITQNNK
ncbi:MAG: MFS transporter [Pyrobaculum sp.]|nr:MFS transporter [Pyrobaculum sp.]